MGGPTQYLIKNPAFAALRSEIRRQPLLGVRAGQTLIEYRRRIRRAAAQGDRGLQNAQKWVRPAKNSVSGNPTSF